MFILFFHFKSYPTTATDISIKEHNHVKVSIQLFHSFVYLVR